MIWHPAETAPKDGSWVLVWDHGWCCPMVVRWNKKRGLFVFAVEPGIATDIICWTPITKPEGVE